MADAACLPWCLRWHCWPRASYGLLCANVLQHLAAAAAAAAAAAQLAASPLGAAAEALQLLVPVAY